MSVTRVDPGPHILVIVIAKRADRTSSLYCGESTPVGTNLFINRKT